MDNPGIKDTGIFQREELLLGTGAMERAAASRVIIFGVGGVGSWCAESLVRSGIGHLTIVDSDLVCPSNINRQLMATTRTVGQPKVDVLRERLLEINPAAEVTAVRERYSEETAGGFNLAGYDYIIDAIDSLKDKATLILAACRTGARFFSSMGAALKIDPSRIRVADFLDVKGDPLARALRKKLKKMGQAPERGFLCVFSDELLENRGEAPSVPDPADAASKRQVNGTVAHITAIFGFTLAGLVMQDIAGR